MVTYVDDMFKYPMGRFGRMKMSHMIADTEDELHAMAQAVGVRRKWYQGDHYDVAMSARAQAIELGAVEVTLKTLAKMHSFRRVHKRLPTPDEAEAWFQARRGILLQSAQDVVTG